MCAQLPLMAVTGPIEMRRSFAQPISIRIGLATGDWMILRVTADLVTAVGTLKVTQRSPAHVLGQVSVEAFSVRMGGTMSELVSE